MNLPKAIQELIEYLKRLPGIGQKSAQRLAFHILNSPNQEMLGLGKAILELKENLVICPICQNVSDRSPCTICSDPSRDKKIICVVEDPLDMIAIENSGFRGLYHIIGGAIAPNLGIGPEDLKIKELIQRLEQSEIEEVIVATNPSVEGEATALYLQKIVSPLGIKITRIARGIPMGGDLEYVDELTLSRALEGRKEY